MSHLKKKSRRAKLLRFGFLFAAVFLFGWFMGHEHVVTSFFVAVLDHMSHSIISD